METANMMRVNARSGNFAGNGNSPRDKHQQHRQKVLALFDAINSDNLDAARHAFQALVNFDPATAADTHFSKLSKYLNSGSIYLAQQWVKEFKSTWVNSLPLLGTQKPKSENSATHPDGLHIVDVRA